MEEALWTDSQPIIACSVCDAHSSEARSSDVDSEEEATAGPSRESLSLEHSILNL